MPEGLTKWRRRNAPIQGASTQLADDEQEDITNNDMFRVALRRSMDDLFALVALVRGFVVSGGEETENAVRWLEKLSAELDDLDKDLEAGCLDGFVTIDDLSSLVEVLDAPFSEASDDGAAELFPLNMLNFWLQEIQRRAWELFHLAIGSAPLYRSKAVGDALKSMKYPLA